MIDVLLRDLRYAIRSLSQRPGFAVLTSPDVPSVLLELGYLSNQEDARNLSQPAYHAGLAAALLRALDRHFARARS